MAVFARPVRKKAALSVGPKHEVQCIEPLFAPRLNNGAPAALQRLFEKVRQYFLERLAFKMIEQNLCWR